MAIINQLFSSLFIISLAFIAITKGMNPNHSGSSSTTCNKFNGKLEHLDSFNLKTQHKLITNDKNKMNNLKLSGNVVFKDTSVEIKIGQKSCKVSFGKQIDCTNLTVDKPQNGALIFTFGQGKQVEVPLKNVQLFNANLCEIELEKYNKEKHIVNLKINGLNFKIIESTAETKACKPENI